MGKGGIAGVGIELRDMRLGVLVLEEREAFSAKLGMWIMPINTVPIWYGFATLVYVVPVC